MLYYLAQFLERKYDVPGAGMFQYISFRASLAVITSLIISMVFGKRIIKRLKQRQIGETVRDLGLDGQKEKEGTPTMGGLIILIAIVIPTLLFAELKNVYVIIMLITTVWLGFIGFLDDYKKITKKNKKGLAGKFKVLGQIVLGIFVGAMVYWHPSIVIREKTTEHIVVSTDISEDKVMKETIDKEIYSGEIKEISTTIPFIKNNELNYSNILNFLGEEGKNKWSFLVFIPIIIFIIVLVSNSANLTDGIDGLATATSSVAGGVLAVFAWVSGNAIFANYLDIMLIPNIGELVIYIAAFIGACIGFLWYNAYPAQVFMGDTGSLALGGIIAVFAILVRKELLLPVFCGVMFVESISVVMQVSWFKYTKKKYGIGKRIFLMSPLHHHYQKKGIHESKIVTRFTIISIMLAVMAIVTLKIR
jgi:phospho-N-acetylmuramoyl-pentapeptide-transferase